MITFDWRTSCIDAERRYIEKKREVDILEEVIQRMALYVAESGDWQIVHEDGSWRQMTPEEIIKDFYDGVSLEKKSFE